ncbi:MAG: c-type heme family protein [Pseudohaliea sp.]
MKPAARRLPAWAMLGVLCWLAQPAPVIAAEALDQAAMASGFQALESACFSCHSPDATPADRIAPPMAAIRHRYLMDNPSLGAFRGALVGFVNDPSAANARMPGAVKRFGVMPALSLDDATLGDVAYYLYHTPLDAPGWAADGYARDKARYAASARGPVTEDEYRRYGQQLAMQTKTALGSNLKKALKEGGPEHAVSFCNTQAEPIADDMSAKLDAAIGRVSDRPRNPANAADDVELAIIRDFKAVLAAGEKPEAALRERGEQVVGYYPIVTNGMCLQCHGEAGTQVSPATLALIERLYPEDKATGYGVNELRGLFVVGMHRTESED